ncbi:MAG TPA: FHA domain-containing protein [Gemmataceae bacterium]|jgi:hypothetical protein
MIRCASCQAENPSGAAVCAQCQAELPANGHDDTPTLHTLPKLVVVHEVAAATSGPSAPAPATDGGAILPTVKTPPPTPLSAPPRLKVIRGLRVNTEFPLYDGENLVGRGDDRPVDVDLRDQEPRDRVWASRNHAVITLADGVLTIEDLNSTNGTYVNRHRIYPGSKRTLKVDDVLQIGTIQLKVTR